MTDADLIAVGNELARMAVTVARQVDVEGFRQAACKIGSGRHPEHSVTSARLNLALEIDQVAKRLRRRITKLETLNFLAGEEVAA